jgi:exopolyphosphatase/pppGpp-phosphohydrolase
MADTSFANGNPAGAAKPNLDAAVSEIKSAVTGKAEELAGRSTQAGAAAVAGVAKTAATLADSLKDQSPAVAEYVRSTGQRIDRLADDLRDKSAGELLTLATDFGKRQPLALLAGAAIIGFALARVVKTGLEAPSIKAEGTKPDDSFDATVDPGAVS